MAYARKVILHVPHGVPANLEVLIETFLSDGVCFVGVVGDRCEHIETLIDEIVVGDGSLNRSLLTASHPEESVQDAIRFANMLTEEYAGESQVVEL